MIMTQQMWRAGGEETTCGPLAYLSLVTELRKISLHDTSEQSKKDSWELGPFQQNSKRTILGVYRSGGSIVFKKSRQQFIIFPSFVFVFEPLFDLCFSSLLTARCFPHRHFRLVILLFHLRTRASLAEN